MTRTLRAVTFVALLSALAAPAGLRAQRPPAADRAFVDANAKETAVRKALAAPGALPTVLRAVRTVVADYEALVKRFPSNANSDDALWKAALLSSDAFEIFGDARERTNAIRLLQSLNKSYAASKWAKQTAPKLTMLQAAQPKASAVDLIETATVAPAVPAPTPAKTTATAPRPGVATITDIRRAPMTEAVRIVIQLDREVSFHDERLESPARIFVDLPSTRASAPLLDQTVRFDGDVDLIRQVRLGRHPKDTTRIVLEASGVSSYSVYPLYNPFRLVIDCLRERPATKLVASALPAVPPALPPAKPAMPVASPSSAIIAAPPPAAIPMPVTPVRTADVAARPRNTPPPEPEPPPLLRTRRVDPSAEQLPLSGSSDAELLLAASMPEVVEPPPIAPLLVPPFRPTLPPATRVIAKAPGIPAEKATPLNAAALPAVPPREPSHNLDGGFSIARQLGLGVSRIVIDPGHGGRDPGTKGGGTDEAELVLDIALRLEKLLLTKQPGVSVVLTRRTDDYVGLQERTAIANREGADLFLSIHANASNVKAARGVETYFLNFATNLSAASVAARENAASGQLMGELPDVVKSIALNSKLDESRDFATYVQREMVGRLRNSNKEIKDLGIKQAPFVVLIGAAMPSVLAEVSFLTNPQEARLLKGGAYRQSIAEALFEGLKKYQASLKDVTLAQQ